MTEDLDRILMYRCFHPQILRPFRVAMHASAAVFSEKPVRVLFCSEQFDSGFRFTQEELRHVPAVDVRRFSIRRRFLRTAPCGFKVVRCDGATLRDAIADATVAIPFGTHLTRPILEQAKKLKLILQYGVGLENIDIETVCPEPKKEHESYGWCG